MAQSQQILGLLFYAGRVDGAVAEISRAGGVLVVPAAPALVRLQHDEVYRTALLSADLAIPDSGLMVLVWKILGHGSVPRISGLTYLKQLLDEPAFRDAGGSFFVLPSESAREKLLKWAQARSFAIAADDCYVAPHYGKVVEDVPLAERIQARHPMHVVIAIGNGPQEKLGIYLRDHLSYRPGIHCIGAALGFLTGDQVAIPDWADRFYLGWLLRLFAQPRIFVPRLARALQLPWLILRYGTEMPPLREKRTEDRGQKTG